MSGRLVMAMVVEKERLIEPHTGEDKGARTRQAFGGAGFEVIGLDEAREEQLDGFATISIQVPFPRVRVRWQLLGSEQPAAVLSIGGYEGSPAKGRVAQQQLGKEELVCRQGLLQEGAFPDRVRPPAGKEGHGNGKN